MLLSMTGYGEARGQIGPWQVLVELRSVNHRHFKLIYRAPDIWGRFELDIENWLRQRMARGSVALHIRVERPSTTPTLRLNIPLLINYYDQMQQLSTRMGYAGFHDLAALLHLPGIVENQEEEPVVEVEQQRAALEALIEQAWTQLQDFRQREGRTMANDLHCACQQIQERLQLIQNMTPQVVAEYRQRMIQRIQEVLREQAVEIDTASLARELAIYAERVDIREELLRLHSHLEQFIVLLSADQSQGRRLEFLCQEMFREANTLGSKANHVPIVQAAIEIKTTIEQMREIVQNVE